MSRKFVFALLAALAVPSFAGNVDTAAQLRDKALTDTTAWTILESLTAEIGPRPIGSPAYERSRDWAVAKLKALGFTNIKVEPFAKPAWIRGAESAEIVGPAPQKLALIGLGYSLPTPKGGLTAEVAVFASYAEMLQQPPGSLAGKIVVVNQPMTRTEDGSGYGSAVAARNGDAEAAKRGAVAYLVRSISTSASRAPHTGTSGGPGPHIPCAALGVPDADLIAALAKRGPVRLHLNLQSSVNAKAVSFNISGEIKGRDKPDEIVVIGGHLDSWDPGTGAIDDGAGIAITTAAAKLIAGLPQPPRRTIRVVLWGSEENGGSSESYAAAHSRENIVIAGESDLGADRVYALALPMGLPGLDEIMAPLKVIVSPEPPRHGGSDIGGLQQAGVPILRVSNDATRYFDYHHSADDTLAVVDPVQLQQNVAVWASLIYLIADSDIDFHTKPAGR
jgi:Zn-dependent M28 family amino/carboxypeptidase